MQLPYQHAFMLQLISSFFKIVFRPLVYLQNTNRYELAGFGGSIRFQCPYILQASGQHSCDVTYMTCNVCMIYCGLYVCAG